MEPGNREPETPAPHRSFLRSTLGPTGRRLPMGRQFDQGYIMTTIARSRVLLEAAALLTASVFIACDSTGPLPEPDRKPNPAPAVQMEAIGPTRFEDQAGATVSAGPTIVAFRDINRNPVAGLKVIFTLLPGDFPLREVATDINGIASLGSFTLDTITRSYVIRARADGVPAVDFAVKTLAGPAAKLNIAGGNDQRARPGEAVRFLLKVGAVDAFNNVVAAGTPVIFSVSAGGGSITNEVVATDGLGLASSGHWTLGRDGIQEVTARSGDADVVFTASFCKSEEDCPSRELAFGRDGNIFVSDLSDSRATLLIRDARDPVWSPDGSRIAFVRFSGPTSQVCIADADGNGINCTASPLAGSARRPAWSPDSRQIIVSSGACGPLGCAFTTYLITIDAMEWTTLDTPSLLSLSWSPDGTKIAFVLADEGLGTMNPDGSAFQVLAKRFDSFLPTSVAWSPDGQRLAVALYDESMCPFFCWMALGVTDTHGGKLSVIAETHELAGVDDPVWSADGRITYTRDGRFIVSVASTGGRPELVMERANSPSWRTLR
jgi:Tol biopolymer transport system component